MIPNTHWTKEGYGRFSESLRLAMGIINSRRIRLEPVTAETPNTGKYCRTAGAVAIVDGDQCTGEIRVKGDGVNGEDDKYGVPYSRKCLQEGRCEKLIK